MNIKCPCCGEYLDPIFSRMGNPMFVCRKNKPILRAQKHYCSCCGSTVVIVEKEK